MRAATVVQVLQDLFYVLLHVLFYLWSLLKCRNVPDGRANAGSKCAGGGGRCATARAAGYNRSRTFSVVSGHAVGARFHCSPIISVSLFRFPGAAASRHRMWFNVPVRVTARCLSREYLSPNDATWRILIELLAVIIIPGRQQLLSCFRGHLTMAISRRCLFCRHRGTAIARVHPVHLVNAEQRRIPLQ